MAATPLTEIEMVRKLTGVTTTQFSDAEINSWRLEYLSSSRLARVYKICAVAYQNLASRYPAGTVRIGEQELSGIDLTAKANDWLRRANVKDAFIV